MNLPPVASQPASLPCLIFQTITTKRFAKEAILIVTKVSIIALAVFFSLSNFPLEEFEDVESLIGLSCVVIFTAFTLRNNFKSIANTFHKIKNDSVAVNVDPSPKALLVEEAILTSIKEAKTNPERLEALNALNKALEPELLNSPFYLIKNYTAHGFTNDEVDKKKREQQETISDESVEKITTTLYKLADDLGIKSKSAALEVFYCPASLDLPLVPYSQIEECLTITDLNSSFPVYENKKQASTSDFNVIGYVSEYKRHPVHIGTPCAPESFCINILFLVTLIETIKSEIEKL